MVENASLAARMTMELKADCRWCVTGTPIQNNSWEDVNRLLACVKVTDWPLAWKRLVCEANMTVNPTLDMPL